MALKSKRKGSAGERELANLLREHLDIKFERNLSQARDGGADLDGLPMLAIECKRAAKLAIPSWWYQTVQQAEQTQRVPVLAYRLDRQVWTFKMALCDVVPGFEKQARSLNLTIEFAVDAFCAVVREQFLK